MLKKALCGFVRRRRIRLSQFSREKLLTLEELQVSDWASSSIQTCEGTTDDDIKNYRVQY